MFHNYLLMFLRYLLTQEKENPTRVKVIPFRLATVRFQDVLSHSWSAHRCDGLLPKQAFAFGQTLPILKSEIETCK